MIQKVLCSILILLTWTISANALDIVYPSHQTSFVRSNFLVVKGGQSPQLDAVTVAINGAKSDLIDISSPEYRAAFRDFLILEPEFDPGRNTITVEGFVKGKQVVSSTATVYFLADPTGSAPREFQPFTMHLPEREKLCAPCHNMVPQTAELSSTSAQTNPCGSCHKRMLNRKYVHGPAGVWTCTYCHPTETRPARYQARQGDAKVCNECHADKVKEFRRNKFVHGPVEAEMCSACHDPHATDNIAQLVAPINDLCLSCHEEVGKSAHAVRGVSGKGHPLAKVNDPSRKGRELSCTGCHDPHGGQSKALFQRGISTRFALCGLCHQK